MDNSKILISVIIAAFIITVIPSAWSNDWVCYSQNKDTSECQNYYDKKVKHRKNIIDVMTRLTITDEVRTNIGSLEEDDTHIITLKRIDCQKETVSVIKTVVYKIDGTVSSSIKGKASVKHQIDPDSRDGDLFKAVCRKGK